MPSIISRTGSSSISQEDLEDSSKTFQELLRQKDFHLHGNYLNGCYHKKVVSKSNDLPELIRKIFPINEDDIVYILAKGQLKRHANQNESSKKESDEDNSLHLANLGRFLLNLK